MRQRQETVDKDGVTSRLATVALAACLAALAACGGGDDSPPPPDDGPRPAVTPILTVRAEDGGMVSVSGTVNEATVGAGGTADFTVDSGSAVTLVASENSGHRFDGWTLPSGLACGSGGASNQRCVLAAGSVSADATVSARFETVTPAPPTLTVRAEDGGTVSVSGADNDATVAAGGTADFTVDSESTVTLVASENSGHRFAGWTLPSGLACGSGGASNPRCVLAAGSVSADATVSARFEPDSSRPPRRP